jgi:ABC-type nitrate/sulfonate/bicarbonate transport system substrate-binding protein
MIHSLGRKAAVMLGLFSVAIVSQACKEPRTTDAVVLQREWTANAEFAGDLVAQDSTAKLHGLQLEVREGGPTLDPVKQVRSGTADIGVASADRILRENAEGADLVIVGAATARSPVVFLSRVEKGVRSAADFRGKVVGIQSGTNTELIYKALLAAQRLDSTSVRAVESGWGTQAFEANQFDILAAFAYDEPIKLERKGLRFNTLSPEAAGVRFIGTVYFTRRRLVEDSPERVNRIIGALVSGWMIALADTNAAFAALERYGKSREMELDKGKLSFLRGRPYFAGDDGRVLFASKERWAAMGEQLVRLGLLEQFSFDANVDYRFVDAAHSRMSR